MRFNTETNDKPLTRPLRDVCRSAKNRKKMEAATAVSIFTVSTGRHGYLVENEHRSQSLACNLQSQLNSQSAKFNPMNFEIQRFKNQMTHFIFRLRPVYFAQDIKEA
jgi:hypothetical protein